MPQLFSLLARRLPARSASAFLGLLLLGALSPAHAITGTIAGTLEERLLLSRCSDAYAYPDFTLTLKTGQKFAVTSNGRTYTGTFTKNAAQTTLVFTMDAASKTRLASTVARMASRLCGATVTVSAYSTPVIKLNLVYGSTRAATCNIYGSMTVTATGRTIYGSGSANYRLLVNSACFEGKP